MVRSHPVGPRKLFVAVHQNPFLGKPHPLLILPWTPGFSAGWPSVSWGWESWGVHGNLGRRCFPWATFHSLASLFSNPGAARLPATTSQRWDRGWFWDVIQFLVTCLFTGVDKISGRKWNFWFPPNSKTLGCPRNGSHLKDQMEPIAPWRSSPQSGRAQLCISVPWLCWQREAESVPSWAQIRSLASSSPQTPGRHLKRSLPCLIASEGRSRLIEASPAATRREQDAELSLQWLWWPCFWNSYKIMLNQAVCGFQFYKYSLPIKNVQERRPDIWGWYYQNTEKFLLILSQTHFPCSLSPLMYPTQMWWVFCGRECWL